MNCTECTLTELPVRAAIGCCTHCGAGVCPDHAVIQPVARQPVGLVVPAPARRRLTCVVCTPLRKSKTHSRRPTARKHDEPATPAAGSVRSRAVAAVMGSGR
jgi:hypothetical protein